MSPRKPDTAVAVCVEVCYGKRKDSWGLAAELLAANGFWEMGRHNIHLYTHW